MLLKGNCYKQTMNLLVYSLDIYEFMLELCNETCPSKNWVVGVSPI